MSSRVSYADYGVKNPHLLREHNLRVMGLAVDSYKKEYKPIEDPEEPSRVPSRSCPKNRAAQNKARALQVLADMESGKLQIDNLNSFAFEVHVSKDWVRHHPDIKEKAKSLLIPRNSAIPCTAFQKKQREKNLAKAAELLNAMESGDIEFLTVGDFCKFIGLSPSWISHYPELNDRVKRKIFSKK